MSRIGERFGASDAASKYIRHPTNGWLPNGDPVDAGSIQTFDQNLSHLSWAAPRLLFQRRGPGTLRPQSGTGGAIDGYDDWADRPPPTNRLNEQLISWSPDVCENAGPFPLTVDGQIGTGALHSFRKIKVVVKCSAGAINSLKLLFALTERDRSPWTGSPLYFTQIDNDAVTGAQIITHTLQLVGHGVGAPPSDIWHEWFNGAITSGQIGRTAAWPVRVWVGWKPGHDSDAVHSISGYETR